MSAFQGNAFQDNAFYISAGGLNLLNPQPFSAVSVLTASLSTGITLSWSANNVSSLSCDIRTGSRLQGSIEAVSTLTASLLTGSRLSANMLGVSTLSAEFSSGGVALESNLVSVSSLTVSIRTGVRLNASLVSNSAVTAVFYTEPSELPDTTQNKKLILIQDAGAAYPVNTINDAMDTYLEQRYSVSGSLSDLIARYLGE